MTGTESVLAARQLILPLALPTSCYCIYTTVRRLDIFRIRAQTATDCVRHQLLNSGARNQPRVPFPKLAQESTAALRGSTVCRS